MSPHTEPPKNSAEGPRAQKSLDSWWWRHLPVLLITIMLLIATLLELVVVPPLAWPIKLPLVLMLALYAWAPRLDKLRSG